MTDHMAGYKVAALYKFVDFEDFKDLQGPIVETCNALDIRGTLLLAHEGINGTVAGQPQNIDRLIQFLRNDAIFSGRLSDLDVKYSSANEPPFLRMRVRLKKEIVAIKKPEANPNHQVGTYVDAKDWNALITDPDVVVIDTRNDYEYKIGTFQTDTQGKSLSLNPKTNTFGEFPEYVENNLSPEKHKKVAMFCTGGIRCEKASSYMLAHGYEEVYHLKGGILKYLEDVPAEDSLWAGDCFVFDERVSVGQGLVEGAHQLCHACRMPLSPDEVNREDYIEGIQCLYCVDEKSADKRNRAAQRQYQIELAHKRGEPHLGKDAAQHAQLAKERKKQAKEAQQELHKK